MQKTCGRCQRPFVSDLPEHQTMYEPFCPDCAQQARAIGTLFQAGLITAEEAAAKLNKPMPLLPLPER